ncbi:MAG: Mrp/NBP35 family ATP-binding protein [Desulfobacterales bacterium]
MAFGKNSADQAKRKVQHEEQKKQIRERLRHIKHKILVMSGKGGVGKSSVAEYLAVSLAKRNYDVGLMDVDLHGPSIPRILGLTGVIQPGKNSKTISPLKYLSNMDVVSIETLVKDRDAAMIWRGPLKGGVIRQFIADVEWNDLDYMIIDSPPGTGDEPLTVAQTIPDAKALIVTTPQELSLADVRKSISFCRQVGMEILGLVENMSGLQCPYCGKIIDVFKQHGGKLTAENENLRLLATLPLVPEVVNKGDSGDMSLLDNRDHPVTQAFNDLVDEIVMLNAPGTIRVIEPAA